MNTIKKNPKGGGGNSHRTVKTASVLFLTVVFVLVLCGAASAGTPLAENQTGTVSGDLYVNTSDPWSSTTLGATNEVTQANTLPTYTSIDSAMVYVNVYSGSGTSNWPVRTTIKLDGNGDGDYDDPGELLGVEDMNIPGTTDGTVYWLNDHCNRVYSDYQVWYDVKNLITSNNPTLYVKTEPLGGDGYDGRIKMLALTVAYNDGDTDQVHYWVLNGQDWIDSGPSTSTFNTDSFNGQVSSATLNTVALVSTDGTYTINGNAISGNLTETGAYYKEHQWDVTGNITPGADTNLTYTNVGSTLKMNLATLTIREAPSNALADTPWPKFGGNNQNTGQSDYNGPSTSNIAWIYTSGNSIRGSAVIGEDGTIYFGNYDGKLYALNSNGTVKWSYTTGDRIYGTPAIGADGTIYTGSLDGKLHAINPDGTLKWTYTTEFVIYGSPVIGADGTIYIASLDYSLYAINTNGTLKWICRTGGGILGSAAIGTDGTIYFASSANYLYAVDPNGTIKWTYSFASQVRGSPSVGADGTIYIGDYGGKLYAINPNGTIKWTYNTGGTLYYNAPAIATDGTIYIGSYDGKMYAINPDGTIKWTYNTGNQIWGSAAIGADGTIYFGSTDNKIYALNPDGTLKWSYTTGNKIYSSPSIGADGTLYIGSLDGALYAFQDPYVAPDANFTADKTSGITPLTVLFTDNSTGTITGRAWDFQNDGFIDSNEKNPTFTYTTPGIYTVKLTVTSSISSDDEIKTDYITVIDDTTSPTVTANPAGGVINSVTQVVLSATDNLDPNPAIYYTLDGTDPTSNSTRYTVPIIINQTTTLKFIAVDHTGNTSPVQTETYIDNQAPTATADPAGGTYDSLVQVTLSVTDDVDSNPKIYYTTNGDEPTTSSTPYTVPISIPATITLKFIAVDASGNVASRTETYTINDTEAPTATATPAGGTYTTKTEVTLNATDNIDPNPLIYYTINSTDPTTNSTRYTGPFYIPGNPTNTLKFISVDITGNISPVQTETYNINDSEAPVVDAVQSWTTVTLSATDNIDLQPAIYYTTNGEDPTTTSGTLYSGPFNIPGYATTVVKFIGVDASGNISPVESRTYTTFHDTDYALQTAYYAEGNVGVAVSNGGTSYGWFAYHTTETGTVTYTKSSLNIPEGATILSARLYQAWTWYGYPGYTVTFNGYGVNRTAFYGGTDGVEVFDVTPYFNLSGDNTASIISGGGANYGTILVVVYQSATEPCRKIWIDEGFNLVYESWGYPNGYAIFNNVSASNVSSAVITTILPSGDGGDGSSITINGQYVNRNQQGGSDPSFNYYNVINVLQNGTNEMATGAATYYSLETAILTLTIKAPVADFTANTVGGFSPVTVQFTDQSTDATGWSWDFDNNGTVDSTEKNPIWTYNIGGTYTVKLTVTGPGGVDDEIKTGLITVDPSMIITNSRTAQVYTNIQDAIDDALTQNGDILTIHNGTYSENIFISKQLTLNMTGVVTINAANPDMPIFTISSAGNGTIITGFNLAGTTNAPAIRLYSADNCQLIGNVITGSNVGIQLYDSDNNTLSGNTIHDNQDTGIYVNQSTGNTFSVNNVVSNGVIGILLREANNNSLTGNTVTGNGWAGIALDNAAGNTISGANTISGNIEGIHLTGSNSNTIDGNSITGNTNTGISIINSSTGNTITNTVLSQNSVMGVYLRDSNTNNLTGNTVAGNGWIGVCLDNASGSTLNGANDISGNLEGLYLVNNSNNTTIQENNIHDNQDAGIYINQSTNNTITGNTTTSNGVVGVLLRETNENTISGNTVTGNSCVGICLDNSALNSINGANTVSNSTIGVYINNHSNGNTINGNIIQNNIWAGLVLETAHNTMVYQNNFINNPLQALAINGTGNQFNRRTTGNHWDNWTTHDPRPIEGNETTYDLYPHTTHH